MTRRIGVGLGTKTISLTEARRRWPVPPKVVGQKVNVVSRPFPVDLTAEETDCDLLVVGPGLPSSPTLLTQANRVGYRVFMTESDLLKLLRERVKANDGNVAATARALGVKKQWLGLVLAGERNPGPKILAKLRLRREVVYLPM